MVARSVVTFGVSTERGTVHAVALSDDDARLPDRLVAQRTFHIGDGKADLARAIDAALEALTDEIGPDREIAGVAVTYRDPAERRAVVTGLAKGPWGTASLVSAKSAHLAMARAMPWTMEFGHLLVCEVVRGHQCFSLISPERDRVVAAIAATGSVVSEATMRPAVTAAWDQFDAAGVQPEAVVLIGSAASEPVVTATLTSGFSVPLIPSRVAVVAAAVGAALVVQPQQADLFTVERTRVSRSAAALVTAATVLAGGLVAGGVYEATASSRSTTSPVLADPDVAANSHEVNPADPRPQAAPERERGLSLRPRAVPVRHSGTGPETVSLDEVGMAGTFWGPGSSPRMTLRPDSGASQSKPPVSSPIPSTGSAQAMLPGQTTPGASTPRSARPHSNAQVGNPDRRLLFPGETTPPQVSSPEFGRWWQNHWRMVMAWATVMTPRV